MTQSIEPTRKKIKCMYCGDSSVNHTLSYLDSIFSSGLNTYLTRALHKSPNFIKKFANHIPVLIGKFFAFFGLARWSDDIEKATSFRSRVVWEEARRRGIPMEQLIFLGRPLDHYRATISGKKIYFESIPILPEFLDMKDNWDDKVLLKRHFEKRNIPVPKSVEVSFWNLNNLEDIFEKFQKPIIVKPKSGSRGRHTTTNIHTLNQFYKGMEVAKQISAHFAIEEHLDGFVCRATVVNGRLAGFYRASAPSIVGDGEKTIKKLIEEKNSNKHPRIENVNLSEEIIDYISRLGFTPDDILPEGRKLQLTYRTGRLFGGSTKEMIDELHPSFVPILEKAGSVVGLAVAGFDCIVPDPTQAEHLQKWGIIECNTLPFIDLHYYALEGKPRNIAGMIWDMWE